MAHHQLVPVSILPLTFRQAYRLLLRHLAYHAAQSSVFKFGVFNIVQSAAFETLINTNNNVVLSAPTGSGKTVIFELCIVRQLTEDHNARIIYIAPTKALCAERTKDWQAKFMPLGLNCVEWTGDSSTSFDSLRSATIIVATPEKLDALSRNWSNNEKLLRKVKVLCLDEVHLLNEDRGAVLEVVVARFKTFGAPDLRFCAVSATASNTDDLAEWLTCKTPLSTDRTATTFKFSEDHRPIPLQRIVLGFSPRDNDFTFTSGLNASLLPLIQRHAEGKAVLIFCSTRKATEQAADILLRDFKTKAASSSQPWIVQGPPVAVRNAVLQKLVEGGIAFHHAGLCQSDRSNVEAGFLKGQVNVICTTSTLAVGINLPAYMVILRGTNQWDQARSCSVPIPDLDCLQMCGRAGRPQFGDKKGIVVIMTEKSNKLKYEQLMSAKITLESCLHRHLTEHINSEISLKSISTPAEAVEWLKKTFLYVRERRQYTSAADLHSRLFSLVMQSIQNLSDFGILTRQSPASALVGSTDELVPSRYGDVMSRFCVSHQTFLRFLKVGPSANQVAVLDALSRSEELVSTARLRTGDKTLLSKLLKRPEILFPPNQIAGTGDKLSILIQSVLGGIAIDSPEDSEFGSTFAAQAATVVKDAARLCRALSEVALENQDAGTLHSSSAMVRSLSAKAWDGSPVVLRQLAGVGEKSIKYLIDGSITTVQELGATSVTKLQSILSRNAAFCIQLIAEAKSFPILNVSLNLSKQEFGQNGVIMDFECSIGAKLGSAKHSNQLISVLIATNDGVWIAYRRIALNKLAGSKSFKCSVTLVKSSQKIYATVNAECLVGIEAVAELVPDASLFARPEMEKSSIDNISQPLEASRASRALSSTSKQVPFGKSALSAGQHGKRKSSKAKQDLSQRVSVQPEETEKLPNGNYRCKHTCKHKCRHLCCREGMPKPPKPSKRKSEAEKTALAKAGSDVLASKGFSHQEAANQPPPSKPPSKPSRGLQELTRSISAMQAAANPMVRKFKLTNATKSASLPSPPRKKARMSLEPIEDDDEDLPDFDGAIAVVQNAKSSPVSIQTMKDDDDDEMQLQPDNETELDMDQLRSEQDIDELASSQEVEAAVDMSKDPLPVSTTPATARKIVTSANVISNDLSPNVRPDLCPPSDSQHLDIKDDFLAWLETNVRII